jgi:hypothetical protein
MGTSVSPCAVARALAQLMMPTTSEEAAAINEARHALTGRGLHSSTSWLKVSALCGTGGAYKDCLRCVCGVSWGIRGYRVYIVSETAQVELKSERG